MRAFGQVAFVGLAGLLSWKVLGGIVTPLFGMAFGLLGLIFKAAVIAAVGYFVVNMIRNRRERYGD